jgi:hypothetical protein
MLCTIPNTCFKLIKAKTKKMKFNKSLIVIALAGFAACNNPTDSKTTTTTDTSMVTNNQPPPNAEPAPKNDSWCFSQQNAGDTFRLNVKVEGGSASGTLDYLFKEKDKSSGTINGTLSGDTLFADYRFNAEGSSSVREVAFLIKDGKAAEGYGDVEEKNGRMQFKNRAAINFGKGIVMSTTDCK